MCRMVPPLQEVDPHETDTHGERKRRWNIVAHLTRCQGFPLVVRVHFS